MGEQIIKNGLGDAHGKMGERRHAYNVLTGKPWGKRLLEKPKCRRDVKMELLETEWWGEHGLD